MSWAPDKPWTALGVEFVATLIFTLVFLGATSARGGPAIAGLIIGLTLVALHLAFISVDRAFGESGAQHRPGGLVGTALRWISSGCSSSRRARGRLVAGWLHQQKWLCS